MLGLSRAQAGQVSTGAGTAVGSNVAAGAGLDVVVAHVAAVGGLVPQLIAIDDGAWCLTGDGQVSARVVGLDDAVAGPGPGATVQTIGLDGIGIGQGESQSGGQGENRQLHFV